VRWSAALLLLGFSLSAEVQAEPVDAPAKVGKSGAKGASKRKARGPRIRGVAGQPATGAGGVDISDFGPHFPVRAVRKLLRRDLSMALEVLPALLTAHPDDPEVAAAWFAMIHAFGNYGEALSEIPFTLGSAWYEAQGLNLHANALRESGRGAEAAALRAELLTSPAYREGTELMVQVAMVHDLIAAGAAAEAVERGELAVAWFPQFGITWAALGAAQLEAGDIDGAWATVDLGGRHLDEPSVELGLLHARLLWTEGDTEAAWVVMNPLRARTTMDPTAWAQRIELMLARDLASDAANLVQLSRFERMQGPNMVAARVAAYRAAGQTEAAAEALREGLAFNPDSPVLRRLR